MKRIISFFVVITILANTIVISAKDNAQDLDNYATMISYSLVEVLNLENRENLSLSAAIPVDNENNEDLYAFFLFQNHNCIGNILVGNTGADGFYASYQNCTSVMIDEAVNNNVPITVYLSNDYLAIIGENDFELINSVYNKESVILQRNDFEFHNISFMDLYSYSEEAKTEEDSREKSRSLTLIFQKLLAVPFVANANNPVTNAG